MTIQQSEKLGIAFVHQELNLFNDLKVYENIFLMKEYKKKTGILDKKRMIRETQQLFTELGVRFRTGRKGWKSEDQPETAAGDFQGTVFPGKIADPGWADYLTE